MPGWAPIVNKRLWMAVFVLASEGRKVRDPFGKYMFYRSGLLHPRVLRWPENLCLKPCGSSSDDFSRIIARPQARDLDEVVPALFCSSTSCVMDFEAFWC